MNMMISFRPGADHATGPFTTQRVTNRMEAAACAINAVIGRDGSTLVPIFERSIVMPIANVILAGTGCRCPLYLDSAEKLGAVADKDVIVLRFDADRGTSFDILFNGAGRWLCRYLAWRRRDGDLWLIPSAGDGLYIKASYAGLELMKTPPFISAAERKAGIILAIETPSFEGRI